MKYLPLFLLFLTHYSYSSNNTETIDFNVILRSPGSIEVIYHRTNPAGVGAAIGGLLGAAIEQSHQATKDSEKLEQLQPHINLKACAKPVLDAFSKKMEKKEIRLRHANKKQKIKNRAKILEIHVYNCGFKLTDSVEKLLSSYVNARIILKEKPNSKPLLKQGVYLTGKDQTSFEGLLSNSDQLTEKLTKVLEKAGKRIANKIIYL